MRVGDVPVVVKPKPAAAVQTPMQRLALGRDPNDEVRPGFDAGHLNVAPPVAPAPPDERGQFAVPTQPVAIPPGAAAPDMPGSTTAPLRLPAPPDDRAFSVPAHPIVLPANAAADMPGNTVNYNAQGDGGAGLSPIARAAIAPRVNEAAIAALRSGGTQPAPPDDRGATTYTHPPNYHLDPASGLWVNDQGAVDPNDPEVRARLEASAKANPQADGTGASAATGGGSSDSSGSKYPDLESDPGYQRQKALDEELLQKAASGYLSSSKDALLGYGSQSLAREVLDRLLQDPRIARLMTPADETAFIAQLSDNPDTSTSTVAQLQRAAREQELGQTESYNRANLFYGGQHAKAIGDQSYAEQTKSAGAKSALMNLLNGFGGNYLNAQNGAAQNDLAGFQAAYERALQEALANDTGAGTDPSGGTTTTPPAATTTASPKSPAPAKAAAPVKVKATSAVAPDNRPTKGAAPPTSAKKKKAAAVVYKGRH